MYNIRNLKNLNMFAVILTGGKQYIVEEGTDLKIEKIIGDIGSEFIFDKVLLAGEMDGSALKIGKPTLENIKVVGIITAQEKDKKVRVIKFKRKVRYKRERGHRQQITKVKIIQVK